MPSAPAKYVWVTDKAQLTILPLTCNLLEDSVQTKPKASRELWLDVAKGVGILLLVVLHVFSESKALYGDDIVYFLKLFRMPMFFIVSGFLFAPARPWALAEKRVRTLLLPYVSYLVLVFLLIVGRYYALGMQSGYLSPRGVARLIVGGEYLTREFGVFWFVTSLFATQLLYNYLILKLHGPLTRPFALAVLLITTSGYVANLLFPHVGTPLAIGAITYSLPLFWIGHILKTAKEDRLRTSALCGIVIFGAMACYYLGYDLVMDLKTTKPGVPFLSIALAACLTWLFFEAMKNLSRASISDRIFTPLSEAAICIMFLHQFIHYTLRYVGLTSDMLIFAICVIVPTIFWSLARRWTLTGALFLGTAPAPAFAKRRLSALTNNP